jgi:hypothetical protein
MQLQPNLPITRLFEHYGIVSGLPVIREELVARTADRFHHAHLTLPIPGLLTYDDDVSCPF